MLINNHGYLALIIVLYIILNVSCLHFKTQKLECSGTLEFVQNFSCKTVPLNRHTALSYVDFYLIGTVKNITVNIELSKKDYSNRYHPFLINVTENVCKYFQKKRFSPYLVIMRNILRNISNMIHPCPYNGYIFIHGLQMDAKYVPVPLPSGTYRLRNKYFEGYPYKLVAASDLYMEAYED